VALDAAARWCDQPANHSDLAEMLAQPNHVGVSAGLFRTLLRGALTVDPDGTTRHIPDYLVFHRDTANFPWVSQALWVYSQMVRWGQVDRSGEGAARAASAYRPDIYRAALGGSAAPIPLDPLKSEGHAAGASVQTTLGPLGLSPDAFMDGPEFDPARIGEYLAAFAIRRDGASRPPMTD
jgi:NitT/TauT family transport system ATP-binding protein